jgi:hypothetical protein
MALTSEKPMARKRSSNGAKGKELIGMGLGVGAFGLVSATLLGATCPLCIVAAPTLVGAGLYERWRARRRPDDAIGPIPEEKPR